MNKILEKKPLKTTEKKNQGVKQEEIKTTLFLFWKWNKQKK